MEDTLALFFLQIGVQNTDQFLSDFLYSNENDGDTEQLGIFSDVKTTNQIQGMIYALITNFLPLCVLQLCGLFILIPLN